MMTQKSIGPKLIVALCNFANMSKNSNLLQSHILNPTVLYYMRLKSTEIGIA